MLSGVGPEAALWLVLTGLLLLYVEFNRPGTIVPGALGMLLAMLGVGALARWPLCPQAGALVLGALGLLAADLTLGARRLLAALALLAMAVGLHGLVSAHKVGWATAAGVASIFVAVSWWLGRVALAARRNKRTGRPLQT